MDSMECPRSSHLLVSLQNVATDSDSTFSYKLFNLKEKSAATFWPLVLRPGHLPETLLASTAPTPPTWVISCRSSWPKIPDPSSGNDDGTSLKYMGKLIFWQVIGASMDGCGVLF